MPIELAFQAVPLLAGTGYAAACALVARSLLKARRRTPGPAGDWPGVKTSWLRLPSRQTALRIAATYHAVAQPRGAVVLVHGKDGCRGRELKDDSGFLARALTARGLNVLAIDLRGHGQSDAGRLSFGLHEGQDVLGAFDWLEAQGFEPRAIGCLGASMGGAAVVAAMGSEPRMVGPVVLDSSFAHFRAMIDAHFGAGPARWLLPGCLWWSRRLLSCDLRTWSPARLLGRCRPRPVLIIHASGDRFVGVDHAHELARAAGTRPWIAGSQRHLGAFRDHPTQYVEVVGDFFAGHIAHARGPVAPGPAPLRLAA